MRKKKKTPIFGEVAHSSSNAMDAFFFVVVVVVVVILLHFGVQSCI